MRGFIKVLDEGEWKDGEAVPLKLDMSLRYYLRERDGVELFEVDQENMIFRVNGRDQLVQQQGQARRAQTPENDRRPGACLQAGEDVIAQAGRPHRRRQGRRAHNPDRRGADSRNDGGRR